MAVQFFALIIIVSLNTIESRRRIFGGYPVRPGHLSFVVRIENFDLEIKEQTHCCTGSLISPQWVLTTAHCSICWSIDGGARIRYGRVEARWNASDTYSNVTKVFQHPGYRADPYRLHQGEKLTLELLRHFVYQNDIALLQIEPIHTIPFGKLTFIEYNRAIGKDVLAVGYGIMESFRKDNTLALSQPLQYGKLMIIECNPTLVINSYPIICVTHKCDKDDYGERVMPGDSGGPLLLNDTVIGVCSYGVHAMHGLSMAVRESGFYTAVGPYLDWIENVIGDNNTPESTTESKRF